MTNERNATHRDGRFCTSPSPWLGARPAPPKDTQQNASKEK